MYLSLSLSLFLAREKPRPRTLEHVHRLVVALVDTSAAYDKVDVFSPASVLPADYRVSVNPEGKWIGETSREVTEGDIQ
jgi:hypothetical protein